MAFQLAGELPESARQSPVRVAGNERNTRHQEIPLEAIMGPIMGRHQHARRGITACGLLFCLLGCLMGATPAPDVQFTDITQMAKIAFKHESSATSNKYLVETMGGGVALLDYDNDGRLDVFFTNGAKIDDPMPDDKLPDKSDRKFWNQLYRQESDGTFTDVTEKAGLTGMPQNHYDMGVAVGDYDNDGFEDIYVTGYGGNTLYHNNGNGTFTDVTKTAGVAAGGWSASAGFFDYDGDGTFTDVSEKAGIANPKGKALGVAFADYDGDGFTDIFVANDSVQCFLY